MSTLNEHRDKHLRKVRSKIDSLLDELVALSYNLEGQAANLRTLDVAMDNASGALQLLADILGEDYGQPPEQLELQFDEPQFPEDVDLGEEWEA